MPNTSILPSSEQDPFDAPKKFKNIDNEPFECTWDNVTYVVQPGEVVLHPKYLVNYMAMHLARKMYKRKAYADFKGTDWERQNAMIKITDPEGEKELQEQMVAVNFEGISETPKQETPVVPTTETPKEEVQETNPLQCKTCDFIAKSEFGLRSHQRKHK